MHECRVSSARSGVRISYTRDAYDTSTSMQVRFSGERSSAGEREKAYKKERSIGNYPQYPYPFLDPLSSSSGGNMFAWPSVSTLPGKDIWRG